MNPLTDDQITANIKHSHAAAELAIACAGLGPITGNHVMTMVLALARRGLVVNDANFAAILGHATDMILERTAKAA